MLVNPRSEIRSDWYMYDSRPPGWRTPSPAGMGSDCWRRSGRTAGLGRRAVKVGREDCHVNSEEAEFELIDEAEFIENEQVSRGDYIDVLRESQFVGSAHQRIQQLSGEKRSGR